MYNISTFSTVQCLRREELDETVVKVADCIVSEFKAEDYIFLLNLKWPFEHFPLCNTSIAQELDETVVKGAGSIVFEFQTEDYIFIQM